MKYILVWDLPTRLLHWAFAFSVSASLIIALAVEGKNPLFQFHMLFGLLAAFFAVVRVVWGVIGTRHAQFVRFPLSPIALLAYVRGLLDRNGKRFPGHNPGAAWAAIAMFALLGLLVATGLGGGGEAFEDVHEVLAYVLLSVIGLHLAGLAWHTARHRENIAASMVTGRKAGIPMDEISSARPLWALALLAGSAAWVGALFISHDPKASTVRIPVIGAVLQLGEQGDEEKVPGPNRAGGQKDDDDD